MEEGREIMKKYKTKEEIELLFGKLNLRHIINNESIYPELKNYDLRASSYYIDNYDEFIHLEKEYGKQLTSHYQAPLYVKNADDGIGYGLFSDKPMKEGDLIGQYTGIVQEAFHFDPEDKETAAKTEYAWDYPDEIPGLPPLEINARYAGGVLRFVNHSFQPNLRIEHTVVDNEWKIFFVADENIETDAELFVDYGDDYWSADFREVIIP